MTIEEKKRLVEERISGPIQFSQPDIKKIPCRDCFLREKDRMDGQIKGATLYMCEAFPEGKPEAILWHHESCPYYIDESEEN